MGRNREHENIAESDSDSTDNDSQESEPEETQTTPAAAAKKPLPKSASKPTPAAAAKKPSPKSVPKPETSSESGSSDSDSDGPDSPIPTQPQKLTTKSRSKSSAADPVTPAALKRPAAEEKESNKLKKKKAAEPESSERNSIKKSIIQRKWSEGDELVILQGMIDNPTADVNALLDLIKENLDREDALKSNLQDKINKLKKKYENNWIKEKKGKEMSFLKPHEQKVYGLSKLVWGRNKRTIEEAAVAKEGKAENEGVWLARMKSIGVSAEERVLTIGAEMFENGKGDAAGAKEWKKLRIEEIQAFLRQLEVKTAQTRLVIELLKK